ncbi:hypothetical protein [Phenylobacterium sp.]|uniref:hypothetical protein n=1 Tax=Phenylobacterium sp. TaxID=1871053 RepID=UPI00374DACAD
MFVRALTLALTCVALAPLAAAAAPAATYVAPRNAIGQPDLAGFWSNSTLTPMTRETRLGDRLTYTPAEVKALEADESKQIEAGNKPTDPNAPVNAPNGLELKPSFAAAGGDVGGYNRGWLDPGHLVMRVGGQPRTSLITTPNGQIPPRKTKAVSVPGYGAEVAEGSRGPLGSMDNPENRGVGERCIIGFGRNAGPPMFPNGFYNNNYNIVQTRDSVVIQVEMVHDTRIVHLNAKHRTDGLRPWFGDSIGWWDGDTLVVETTNIPAAEAFMGSWKDLKITERFTRAGKERLRYAFTVSDPTAWDAPWGGEYEFTPLHGIIYEYACHEGNYALPGILGGARMADREKAGAPAKSTSGSNN